MIPKCYSSTFIGSRVQEGNADYHAYEFRRHDKYGMCLFLDGVLQSAESDQSIYHKKLVRAALEENPHPSDILIIGGAGGGVLHQLSTSLDLRKSKVVIVDIDEKLFKLAQKLMRSWNQGELNNPNLEVVFENGKDYLKRINHGFDVVILDVGDPIQGTMSNDIFSASVLRDISRSLRLGGVVSFHTAPEYTYNHIFVKEVIRGNCALKKMSHFKTSIPSFEHEWIFSTLKKQAI